MFEAVLAILRVVSYALLFANMTPDPKPVLAPVVIQAPLEEAPYTDADTLVFDRTPRAPKGAMKP